MKTHRVYVHRNAHAKRRWFVQHVIEEDKRLVESILAQRRGTWHNPVNLPAILYDLENRLNEAERAKYGYSVLSYAQHRKIANDLLYQHVARERGENYT